MSEEKPETRTLGLSPRFLFSQDGRVFRRKGGTEVSSLSLAEATKKAKASLGFNHCRETKKGSFHGWSAGTETLVFETNGELCVRIVIILAWRYRAADHIRQSVAQTGQSETFSNHRSCPIHGDTKAHWYFLPDEHGGNILFHGPSWAAASWHLRST